MSEPKRYWLDNPGNVTKLYRGLWVVCFGLVSIDFVLHKHEAFDFASRFGFYGLYGFLACVALVLTAKQMRRVVMRGEDYYDR